MAIDHLKATWIFKDVQDGRAGWCEEFYIPGGQPRDVNEALTNSGYPPARAALMPTGYTLQAVRVSTVPPYTGDNPRGLSSLFFFRGGGVTGTYPLTNLNPDDPSEEPYDALKVRFEGAVSRRIFLLRGLPTTITAKVSSYNEPGSWINRFNTWLSAIKTMNAQIRKAGAGAFIPASLVTVGADGKSLLMTFDAGVAGPINALASGAYVRVSGVTGMNYVNHLWRVKTAGNNVLKTYPGRVQLVGEPGGVSGVQIVTYTYDPITNGDAQEGTKRSTGRPFDLLRGKRQARRT